MQAEVIFNKLNGTELTRKFRNDSDIEHAPVSQILEISLIHNAEFIMLNDFAKPKELSKISEYDISLCIHNYALCIHKYALCIHNYALCIKE